jgi:hypothetical protein
MRGARPALRLKAYVLAADPAWIEASVLSYYEYVAEIVVSYDESGRGWTGAPIDVATCLRRLREIDRAGKMRFCGGSFYRAELGPMGCDTFQRSAAIAAVGADADWVLQLDTDEVLPDPDALLAVLRCADEMGAFAVDWPMRVLYQRLRDGRYLEVCDQDGSDRFEYPGSVAVRAGAVLDHSRFTKELTVRAVVRGDDRSLQLRAPAAPNERRIEIDSAQMAIIHNSWARSEASIRSKIASWSHNEGLKSRLYYHVRWRPTPYLWRWTRDFHPFARGLWPALKPCASLPPELLRIAQL